MTAKIINIVGIIKKKRRKKMPSLSQRGHFCSQRDCPPVSNTPASIP
jgi:hypothetical protein